MCLSFIRQSEHRTKHLKERKKSTIGYKVLYRNMRSEFRDFRWEEGRNISSRDTRKISYWETYHNEISQGFHFFLNLEDAIKQVKARQLILECIISPKHIVSAGVWQQGWAESSIQCIVATEAIAITRIKRNRSKVWEIF